MVASTRRRSLAGPAGKGVAGGVAAPAVSAVDIPSPSTSASKNRKRRGAAAQPLPGPPPAAEEETAADAEAANETAEGEEGKEGGQGTGEDSPASFDVSRLPLRVFVGTYAGVLYCLESLRTVGELLSSAPLPPSSPSSASVSSFFTRFSHEAHRQSIHALAVSPTGSHLLSGGVDETIQLFSLAPRPLHVGSLHRHYSSITALAFPTSSHFLSASEEGSIAVFALPSCEAVTRLRGARGAAQALAVHPSGKAAMTAGRDGVVRVWDLVRGAERTRRWMGEEKRGIAQGGSGQAFEPLLVQWRGSGAAYVLARGRRVRVFDDRGEVARVLDAGSRVLAIAPALRFLLVGCDDGRLLCFDADSGQRTAEVRHTARVRAVEAVKVDGERVLVVSASTDGEVQLWRLHTGREGEGEEGTLERVGGAKGQMRVTAMCAGVAWDEGRELEALDTGEGAEAAVEEPKADWEPSEAQLRRKDKKKRRLQAKLRRGRDGEEAEAEASPAEEGRDGTRGAAAAADGPSSGAQPRQRRRKQRREGGQDGQRAAAPAVQPSPAGGSDGAVRLVNRKKRARA